jgi:hypothetical protein
MSTRAVNFFTSLTVPQQSSMRKRCFGKTFARCAVCSCAEFLYRFTAPSHDDRGNLRTEVTPRNARAGSAAASSRERRQRRGRPRCPGPVRQKRAPLDAPAIEAPPVPDDMVSDNPILSALFSKSTTTPKLDLKTAVRLVHRGAGQLRSTNRSLSNSSKQNILERQQFCTSSTLTFWTSEYLLDRSTRELLLVASVLLPLLLVLVDETEWMSQLRQRHDGRE